MITSFDYKNGKLIEKQTITMLSPDFKGKVGAADSHASQMADFYMGSNRGDANELVIYAINRNGKLSFAGRQQTLGTTSSNFVNDPTGNFLLVANQESNAINMFKRDQETGFLTPTGEKTQVSSPACLKFVIMD
jgi:6-phosphogluconolactonase